MKDETLFVFYIKLGNNSFIEIFEGDPGLAGYINHLAVKNDDLDQAISRIRSHGFESSDKKFGCDNMWQSWTKDPNGVRIEFQQYTDQSIQFRGEMKLIGETD